MREDALANLKGLVYRTGPFPDPNVAQSFWQLTIAQLDRVAVYVESFLRHEDYNFHKQIQFDYGDCAVGNILIAGSYLHCDRDFNKAIDDVAKLCDLRASVLNVTAGRNLVLTALKENGQFLPDESSIVSPQDNTPIFQIFLLENYLTASQLAELESLDTAGRAKFLAHYAHFPEPNPRVIQALAEADIIVYGPGTQHSSLFPSYLTKEIGEAIAANKKAEKIFIGNIALDHDIGSETADSLIHKFHTYMNRNGDANLALSDFMTRAFIQTPDDMMVSKPSEDKYVPFEFGAPDFSGSAVLARNWEAEPGRHLGGLIVDELIILLRHLHNDVQPYRHMISIVVPALNEERTIEQVLHALIELDASELDVEKEIIVVDGGSSDRTFELAKLQRDVQVYQTKAGAGRGAAIRLGFSKARGNVIVTFPSDNEYSVSDIRRVVQPILSNQFDVVIGSRSIKCVNLENTLQYIYGQNRLLYFLSKYGGMLLSILCLVLYNRYVSDPLSSLKGYDRMMIENLNLQSDGVSLECEIIAKVSQLHCFILEVPVDYMPRTRAEGKKTTLRDGIAAIAALFTSRVKPTKKPS